MVPAFKPFGNKNKLNNSMSRCLVNIIITKISFWLCSDFQIMKSYEKNGNSSVKSQKKSRYPPEADNGIWYKKILITFCTSRNEC